MSCFLLYVAFDTNDRVRQFLVFALCLLFAVLASATGASGLLSWGVILVGAIAIRANYKYFIVIVVVTALSVIVFRTRSDIGFIADGGLNWLLHPIDYLIELSYFFGSVIGRGLFIQPFAHYSKEVSVIIGMLILALALYLVIRWLLNVRKLDLSSIGIFAIITFGLGWGFIYILKHGSVPPHPKNWIAAGDNGLVIFPMAICIIFQIYRELRSAKFKPVIFLAVLMLYLVMLPSHIFNWELAKNEKFKWEIGLSRSITQLALTPKLNSVAHPHYEPAILNRATIETLVKFKYPPFSDQRIRAVYTHDNIFKRFPAIEKCSKKITMTEFKSSRGTEIILPSSQIAANSIPMVINSSGDLIGYAVRHQKLFLRRGGIKQYTSEEIWVVPFPRNINSEKISIVLLSSNLASVCRVVI